MIPFIGSETPCCRWDEMRGRKDLLIFFQSTAFSLIGIFFTLTHWWQSPGQRNFAPSLLFFLYYKIFQAQTEVYFVTPGGNDGDTTMNLYFLFPWMLSFWNWALMKPHSQAELSHQPHFVHWEIREWIWLAVSSLTGHRWICATLCRVFSPSWAPAELWGWRTESSVTFLMQSLAPLGSLPPSKAQHCCSSQIPPKEMDL